MPLPSQGAAPTDRFDINTVWWRHERLHRAALLGNFAALLDEIGPERDAMEADSHTRVSAVLNGGSFEERRRTVYECWRESMDLEDRWLARLADTSQMTDSPYYAAWAQMNQIAGM